MTFSETEARVTLASLALPERRVAPVRSSAMR